MKKITLLIINQILSRNEIPISLQEREDGIEKSVEALFQFFSSTEKLGFGAPFVRHCALIPENERTHECAGSTTRNDERANCDRGGGRQRKSAEVENDDVGFCF